MAGNATMMTVAVYFINPLIFIREPRLIMLLYASALPLTAKPVISHAIMPHNVHLVSFIVWGLDKLLMQTSFLCFTLSAITLA